MTDDESGTDPLEHSPSELEAALSESVERAGVTGRVGPGDGGTVDLTLMGSRRLPFSLDTEEAAAWLDAQGIEAAAAYDDGRNLVISLRDKTGVMRLVERLLARFMYAESVADRLERALALHRVGAEVVVEDADSVALVIRDVNNLERAVQLGAVLGAENIGDGLRLYRPGGMRKLAARMRLLLTGAVGAGVAVLAEPGCVHVEDTLRIHLSVDQGLRLAGRLVAEPVRTDREEDYAAVGDVS
ncbi:hypothetical protein OG275_38290 (plasmid) [Streptomyces niveus]|uniref:hypothetical protein n=1 Tax=Streptomyces niveus TaxID=193462 RepID=UPI002E3261C3|nr:hypothetical protein [Streptomyces niveus]